MISKNDDLVSRVEAKLDSARFPSDLKEILRLFGPDFSKRRWDGLLMVEKLSEERLNGEGVARTGLVDVDDELLIFKFHEVEGMICGKHSGLPPTS